MFCLFNVAGCTSNTATPLAEIATASNVEESQNLFDDFSYSTLDEMTSNGWVVRDGTGWPGVTGATFRAENVSWETVQIEPWNADNTSSSAQGSLAGIPWSRR